MVTVLEPPELKIVSGDSDNNMNAKQRPAYSNTKPFFFPK